MFCNEYLVSGLYAVYLSPSLTWRIWAIEHAPGDVHRMGERCLIDSVALEENDCDRGRGGNEFLCATLDESDAY